MLLFFFASMTFLSLPMKNLHFIHTILKKKTLWWICRKYTYKGYWWVPFAYVANLKICNWEGHVKGDCKCAQQQHREDDNLQKRTNNLSKHDNVDAYAGKFGAKFD